MSTEINLVWQELQADFSTPPFAWQLTVIVGSLLLAWSINGLLRAYVMRHAPENWKIGIGLITSFAAREVIISTLSPLSRVAAQE